MRDGLTLSFKKKLLKNFSEQKYAGQPPLFNFEVNGLAQALVVGA